MRLTRRGRVVVGVVLVALAMAWAFGPRSLNAVAAPAIAALAIGAWQVRRAPEPTASVESVPPGYPGESRTLALRVEGRGVAQVDVALPEGLGGETHEETVPLPTEVELPIQLVDRGRYGLGAVDVLTRDALGLVAERHAIAPTESVLVYPQVYPLGGSAALERLFADELLAERQEFERLREYVPGDPLRHVHWKSSAKHDDYLVMEFAPTQRTETVRIAGTAEPGCADEMASAAASLAVLAVQAGLEVALTLPGEELPPGAGEAHRENALRLLARVGAGTVPDTVLAEADVAIEATESGTELRLGRRGFAYGDLTAGRQPLGSRGVVA